MLSVTRVMSSFCRRRSPRADAGPGRSRRARGRARSDPSAAKIVANLIAQQGELGTWNSGASIGLGRPGVEIPEDALRGDDKWRERVRASLRGHFEGEARDP